MNPDVANVLTAGCAIAVLLLVSFVAGWVRGSDAGRKLLEREQARAAALDRIKSNAILRSDGYADNSGLSIKSVTQSSDYPLRAVE